MQADIQSRIQISLVPSCTHSFFHRLEQRLKHESMNFNDLIPTSHALKARDLSFLSPNTIAEIQKSESYKPIAQRIIEFCEEYRIQIISSSDVRYPTCLRDTYPYSCPPIVYVWGNTGLLEQRSVGIVGSREATSLGKSIAYRFAKELSDLGCCIASGYAIGIDREAHKGSVMGKTGSIFILSRSIESISGDKMHDWAEYSDKLLFLSQFHPFIAPPKGSPLIRNQTIVGVSNAIIVVEAQVPSGTLATAMMAIRAKKPVGVVLYNQDAPAGNKELLTMKHTFPVPHTITDPNHLLELMNYHRPRAEQSLGIQKQWDF